MTKEPKDLYKEDKLKEASEEMVAMAERFGVRKEDVVFAVWAIAKDSVWAKLALDLKEKKEEAKQRRKGEKKNAGVYEE